MLLGDRDAHLAATCQNGYLHLGRRSYPALAIGDGWHYSKIMVSMARIKNETETKVYEVALDSLRPDPSNANAGSVRGQSMLESSISETGLHRGVTVDANDILVAGNKTQQAAIDAGFKRALVVETDGDTLVVTKRRDFNLLDDNPNNIARKAAFYDNRASEVSLTWNAEQLLSEMQSGFDFQKIFQQDELDALLAGLVPPEPISDPGADVSKAEADKLAEQYGTKPGQVWQLGRHKIACLDCTDRDKVKELVTVCNMVWADPPYGIDIVAPNGYVGGGEAYNIPFGGKKAKGFGSTNGAKPFGSKAVRGSDGAANIVDVGKYAPVVGDETTETAIKSSGLYLDLYPDALHIWWGANYYANALPPTPCWIVWDKENTGNFADAELAWCSSPTAVRIFKHMWNGMLKDSEHGQRRVHPTQKPIELARWAFEKYGKAGDVIVDPFLGSGISVLAAEQLNDGRSVIGFELAHEYIAATIHRWSVATGQTPVLMG